MNQVEAILGENMAGMLAGEKIAPKAVTENDQAELDGLADPGGVPPPCPVPKLVIEKFQVMAIPTPCEHAYGLCVAWSESPPGTVPWRDN